MLTHASVVVLLLTLCLAAGNCSAAVSAPKADEVLKMLRPGHPRLILTEEALTELRARVAADPVAAGYLAELREEGERILTEPPVERGAQGTRVLSQSRRALSRISALALLYRVDGDRKWAQRALKELRAVVAFPDWNHQGQFLDVAEMTAAVAFGYDWLHDYLSPDERKTIRTALVEKGLKHSLSFYRGEVDLSVHVPWAQVDFNWNVVCNGGMLVGALAVADEEPGLSGHIVSEAVTSLPIALDSYGPDGGWPEGPGYWLYATQYLTYTLHTLRSALGTDFGLGGMPGTDVTGYYAHAMVGPSGEAFNYGDGSTRLGVRYVQHGLANWFRDPALSYLAREASPSRGMSAFDLIWHRGDGKTEDVAALPLDHCFSRVQIATMRSSWTAPDALFVGFRAGDNSATHGHLDLGSFVLDALGVRWADDLGADSYSLPGYWDYEGEGRRGTYYRLGTVGHNTLLLDGKNQDHKATAKFTEFRSRDEAALAVVDLSDAYAPAGAARVRRGIALLDGRTRVLVQDEVAAKDPVEVVWSMHTRADIALDPDARAATLRRDGKTLHARLLAPIGAHFAAEEVTIPPPQRPLEGERKLLVRLPARTARTRIAVVLSAPGATADALPLTPLDDWR